MTEEFDQDTQALIENLTEDEEKEVMDEEAANNNSAFDDLPDKVKAEVQGWKLRFGGDVYSTAIGDKTFVWRTLRWNEYKEIQRKLLKIYPVNPGADANDIEMADMDRRFANMELTIQTCLLYPSVDLNTVGGLGPGTIFTLHQNIADASGFEPEFVEKL
jgi:hypothetical protein